MTFLIAFVSLTVICLLVHGFAASASPHAFSVHDLQSMDRISDPEGSPDGKWVVFVKRVTDLEANKGVNDLWLVPTAGGPLRRLTTHPKGSSHPRWASDGRWIYFLSGRGGSSQVWRIAVDGGEAEQVTDQPLDIGAFAVSPDGEHLAIAMEVFPELATPAATKERLAEEEKRKSTGRVYEALLFRHWDTWKDGRRSHVFVVSSKGGDAIAVMGGMDADVPSKPFGGSEEFVFAPDGKSIVFAARNVGREEAWKTHFDLYQTPVDGSAEPRRVVDGEGAFLTQPVFSNDGKTLGFLAMRRAGYEADRIRVATVAWPGGEKQFVTEAWDRSAAALAWSPDDKAIYTVADNLGQKSLFAIDVQTGEVREVFHEGKHTAVVVAGNRLVFARCDLRHPSELYTAALDGSEVRQLSDVNGERLSRIKLGEPEHFSFKGWNEDDVYCYVVKPVDFDPKKRYPVAFLIHGGPQGSFGNDFHYRWNPQTYAGAGYATIAIDFHASTGYGQDFTDAINGHWGDRPLEDLQKGLEAALGRFPWMDRERIGALGASYGGYMINWIAGNWSEPFKCFVNHDGNLDERMAYYDTEELWFPEWERGGTPWEKPEAYTKHNPIDHVHKWDTPMLVIHGGKDYRVVDTQGISTFTALQRRGIPSKFLYFPDENHWVLKPANSIQWHETVIGWLDQWLKKA